MLLSELLQKGAVVQELKGLTTEDALGELIDALILAGCVGADEREKVLISLLKREAISSTGLGDEIAIPHAKVPFVPDFVGAFGYSRQGIDFRSMDSKAVRFVFLLISPGDDPYGHLRLLGTIATLVRRNGFLEDLKDSASPEEAVETIVQAENEAFRD